MIHINYFKLPFCIDCYTQNHCKQHPECWEEDQATYDAGKKAFFEEQFPLKETLQGFFGKKMTENIFMINAPIFSVIIGDMLWDLKHVERQTHANIMACFTDVGDDSEALKGGQGPDCYQVIIKNQLQWYLAIDYLSVGLSYRQADCVLHKPRSAVDWP